MALYFFLMSGSLWWVILTVTLFLSAGLKWGQEAIDGKAHIFHSIAWTVPSIQTIVALVMKKVEGKKVARIIISGKVASIINHVPIWHIPVRHLQKGKL